MTTRMKSQVHGLNASNTNGELKTRRRENIQVPIITGCGQPSRVVVDERIR
jgi:hypothetical protein